MRIGCAEQRDRLRIANYEQEALSARAEHAREVSQTSKAKEAHQTYRVTTESQLSSLRSDVVRYQTELVA